MNSSIAIVGLSCLYPEARTPFELWENVLAQRRAFRRIPDERLRAEDYFSTNPQQPDKTYAAQAAVIEGYEFDRVAFRVVGSTYRSADLAHWLALDIASRALTDAGFNNGENLPREATGVVLGNTLTGEFSRANLMRLRWPYVRRVLDSSLTEEGWSREQRGEFLDRFEAQYKAPFPPIGEETLAGGLSNTIAGRICNQFDLKGGGYTVDGACASSLLAVANACSSLAAGDLDVALAGGVDLSLDPFEIVGFAKTGALAPELMRIYDTRSAGFWPGEGCGFAVLMRHEDAVAQSRRIYATIRGWGISSDGTGGITRPEVDGQIQALRRAYHRAGYGIDTVEYFEGHGTGTKVGDATELKVISRARHESRADAPPAVIGSVKANIGHTKAAAGIAGLIKATLAVHTQTLPPTTGCETPHAELSCSSPALRVLREPEPWPQGRALRAAVGAMGFGGINTHVTLEGHAAKHRLHLTAREHALGVSTQDCELFLVAAPDAQALLHRVEHLLVIAGRLSFSELADLAAELLRDASLRSGARPPTRAAIIASTPSQFAERLITLRSWLLDGVTVKLDIEADVFIGAGSSAPRLGFLFPGQGSPENLTGGIFRRRFESTRALYAKSSFPADCDCVSTAIAQPAIVTASLAGLKLLNDFGLTASIAIGHSLGEITALHWAGAFDEPALLRITRERGRAMAELGDPTGAMAAIAAPASKVRALLAGESACIVGYNSPRQTVIAGERTAVATVIARAQSDGVRATKLSVSHAFHTPLVAAAAPALARRLEQENINAPCRCVVSTITGAVLSPNENLRDLLCRQITSPVKFTDAFTCAGKSADLWIEVGPGEVLSGLARDSMSTPIIAIDVGGESLRGLWRAIAAAFVLGMPVNCAALATGRVTRPFNLDWKPKFFVNPCERAPVSEPASSGRQGYESPDEASSPGKSHSAINRGSATSTATPLDLVRQLVAERAELPVASVTSESRLLGDLHLNSISVGQLIAEAATRLGLPPIVGLTDFATATVGRAAAALEELTGNQSRTGTQIETSPAGVDSWVRPFVFEWTPTELRTNPFTPTKGDWQVFAADAHPIAAPLRETLARVPGAGVVVCLQGQFDDAQLRLLLVASKAALAADDGKFLLVQSGSRAGSFARTLHLEAPGIHTRVIEVPMNHPEAVDWIASEAATAKGHCDIRYDESGHRHELVMKHLSLPDAADCLPLSQNDVLLVTGGGKGIAAECALELGRNSNARLVLLGRSRPDEDTELANNLERFAAAGIHFRYFAVDVIEARAVKMAIGEAERELGTITAVLHAAGRNVPQSIATLDEAAFRRTLAPKLDGARNVLAAVNADKLRVFVAFGSIIARSGFQGEADYAVANEQLTQLTEEFQAVHPNCRCLAAEWSVWSGVGMGARLGRIESLRQMGVSPITPESGVQMLCRLLSSRVPATSVTVTGRFGNLPTLQLDKSELPLLRFLESPRVFYPGVELVTDSELSSPSDPYVDEHVLDGNRLFPAVMGLEAMAQAAMAVTGFKSPPCFENVVWIRPIVVPADGKTTIRIAALVRKPGLVEVALRADATNFQADYFRATCRFDSGAELLATMLPQRKHDLFHAPPLLMEPERDLYDRLLFHTGRFRRVADYRVLRAKECVCRLEPRPGLTWFGRGLPKGRVLGCPAMRDAAIHAIQACIPHARLLPVGVRRVIIGDIPCAQEALGASSDVAELFLAAQEIAQEGDTYHFDLELRDNNGRLLEKWEDLRLRKVSDIPRHEPWNETMLGPYIERRVNELAPGANVSVACAYGVASDELIQRALGEPFAVLHRADGKPDVGGTHTVSAAHAGDLTLAVADHGSAGCDIEIVSARSPEIWRGMLGPERFQLAEILRNEEDFDIAATRVWSATECLKKSGAPTESSLVFDQRHSGGIVVLKAGERTITTFVERLQHESTPVVISVVTKVQTLARNTGSFTRTEKTDPSSKKRAFEYRLTVSFEDTNVVGNVYFSNYVRWQGKVRDQFLADHAPEILADLRAGLELVTLSVECRYHEQLYAFDKVVIQMRLEELDSSHARMNFDYFKETRQGRHLVATGKQEVGCCRHSGAVHETCPFPPPLLNALRAYL